MPDIRKDIRKIHLEKIIDAIFPKKCNMVDVVKKQVIIGNGKYANKCSFRETDKEYYTKLFKYTFIIEGTTFVDKKLNKYRDFNRKTAVGNAIAYLESLGIVIKCTLYCESEKKLLARLVYQILEEILYVMFSFGEDYNEKKYINDLDKIKKHYHREIISKGLIQLIYTNAHWSDVDFYFVNKDCNDCLLIDNGSEWRSFYNISYIDTRLKLLIKPYNETDIHNNSSIHFECNKIYDLQDKPVFFREEKNLYLDFLHLDDEFFVPNRFCYCTTIKSRTNGNEHESGEVEKDKTNEYVNADVDKELVSLGKEYVNHESKCVSAELNQALMYLRQKYCSDRKQQYMKSFSNIVEIISILLRTNYRELYSDDYNFSNTVFSTGFEQLTYFFEDNKISYSKKEVSIIYRYLLTVWLDTLRSQLELFNFEEMFSLYSAKDEDKYYASIIDKNRITVNRFKSLETLNTADGHYNSFCAKNRALIDDFNTKIVYDVYESFEKIIAVDQRKVYSPFKMLKESVKGFQNRLDWNVPYYLRIIVVDGKTEHIFADKLQGYGHVGDKKTVNLIQDEKYSVEGSDSITLGLNENIVEIKYILKAEYVQEQSDEIDLNNTEVVLKKAHNYIIAFEALWKRAI
ncbi:hypothetical protein SAMN02910353_02434 [Ruminococcus sp. YRD2003]|uniref:hypothetical protein n=1 Tax=Ruminococcus sp. YRD2003 TaxID=1452313 RepID=UPI0008C00B9A|nr:hypothetical protein SAMN02910353_02434 [Ruminococcus flavefaciens]